MTITGVEPIHIVYPEPNDAGRTRHLVLAHVTTSDGLSGWGEAVTLWPEASAATVEIIDGLAPLLMGRDPRDHADISRAMTEHTWWYGVGGIASFAISALDIALWDLTGRIEGVTLLELLGGAAQPSLPVLVSCHAMDPDLDAMAATMKHWVDDHAAIGIKIGMGKAGGARLGESRDRDRAFLTALRQELGPSKTIMMDVGAALHWDLGTAIDRAHLYESFGVDWLEEPLGADNPSGYASLKRETSLRIAYGEREWTPRGIQRIVETSTVDVVGVDPGRCNGITGWLAARDLTRDHGAEINAHAWSGGIVTAASLALSLASDNCRQIEVKPLPSVVQNQLLEQPITSHDGQLSGLATPGLGVHVDYGVARRLQHHSSAP